MHTLSLKKLGDLRHQSLIKHGIQSGGDSRMQDGAILGAKGNAFIVV
jgi:hypothetical protein